MRTSIGPPHLKFLRICPFLVSDSFVSRFKDCFLFQMTECREEQLQELEALVAVLDNERLAYSEEDGLLQGAICIEFEPLSSPATFYVTEDGSISLFVPLSSLCSQKDNCLCFSVRQFEICSSGGLSLDFVS